MLPAALLRLRAHHEVDYQPTFFDQLDALVAAAPAADALIVCNRTQVRGALLAALTRCRCVGRLGVGLDNIDVDGCRQRGISILPATGANAQSVAEYVITTAMLLRRPGSYDQSDRTAAGHWPKPVASRGRELAGATLGIVGYGTIGQLTARLALALGMTVLASTRAGAPAPGQGADGVSRLPLDELLARSDVVSLHVPLTPENRGLINADKLALMQPGAVLINTARGGVVDPSALVAALKAGRLYGAALDVFEVEPLPAGSPFAEALPNLLLTPHVGSSTTESEWRVNDMVATKVLAALGAAAAPAGH